MIRRPNKDHWFEFPIGRAGVVITATISATRFHRIGVELYLHRDAMKMGIGQLAADKAAIESEFGEPLDWQELPNKKASRIAVFRYDVDPSDPASYENLHAWMLDRMKRFRKVFAMRVKALTLDTTEGGAGEDAEDQEMAVPT